MSARSFRRAHQRAAAGEARRSARIGRRTAAVAGAGLGATVLFVPAADAATFTVTKLADTDDPTCDADCSLREAVEDANALGGDDIVTFAAGLSGTITLGSEGTIYVYSDGLQIQGPGASQITVSADDNDRVLNISHFDGPNEAVGIAGLTLTHGDAGSDGGGAVYNGGVTNFLSGYYAAALTITGTTITDSVADYGGGLANTGFFYNGGNFYFGEAPQLTIVDSQIRDNDAGGGGGLLHGARYSDSPLTIRGTTISGNEATPGRGGGLYSVSGPVTIEGSAITGNSAVNEGGGFKLVGADGDLVISGSTISNNTSSDNGGGFHVYYSDGDVTVSDTTLAGNVSESYGGGASLYDISGDVRIDRSTLAGNSATGGGGGLALWGGIDSVTVENSTISGNRADSDADGAGYGGGLYSRNNPDSSRRIRNVTIAGNASVDGQGGGIFSPAYDDAGEDVLEISSTIVANNTAPVEPDLGFTDNPDGEFRVGHSLIGTPGSAPITEAPAGSNLLGVDPLLGPLASNGGPTQTHLPALTSPAIDAGIANGLATDQRGAARTFDAANVANRPGSDATDMGSVELLPGGRLALAECKGATENFLFVAGTPITGTDANDVIVGTPSADQITSGKGKDKVCAGAGNDGVKAGAGKDNVAGQAGKDKLKGNGGNDKLQGNAGRDTLKGGGGKDTLKGGGGKDKLRGGPGRDKLRGGGGKDSERQ